MTTTKIIEVTPSDISQLQHELDQTASTQINPLYFRFTSFDDMVIIERKYAENLIQLHKLNHIKHIPTKLEIVDDDQK